MSGSHRAGARRLAPSGDNGLLLAPAGTVISLRVDVWVVLPVSLSVSLIELPVPLIESLP